MVHRWSERRAVPGVPEPRGLGHAPGEDGFAVGAEGHGTNKGPMVHRWSDGCAVGGVPEPRGIVPARREDGLAVGAEGHGPNLRVTSKDRLEAMLFPSPRRER